MSGRPGRWRLTAAGGEPVGELFAPPDLGLEPLLHWAATVLPGRCVEQVHEGHPTFRHTPDSDGDRILYVYTRSRPEPPF
ncbi:hypothetical protein [Kitasatospora sp. NPDC058046]|uniref:hypothetical protein n=1 Tax=Kitasatospora sp. NPDC058046 TaxID=3346312 RepID=UPI0036D79C5F